MTNMQEASELSMKGPGVRQSGALVFGRRASTADLDQPGFAELAEQVFEWGRSQDLPVALVTSQLTDRAHYQRGDGEAVVGFVAAHSDEGKYPSPIHPDLFRLDPEEKLEGLWTTLQGRVESSSGWYVTPVGRSGVELVVFEDYSEDLNGELEEVSEGLEGDEIDEERERFLSEDYRWSEGDIEGRVLSKVCSGEHPPSRLTARDIDLIEDSKREILLLCHHI